MSKILGDSGVYADTNASKQLKVVLETDAATNPGNVGGVRSFNENDAGYVTGDIDLKSQEIDEDFRGRQASDTLYDEENISYTAQNTGKHFYANTTMTNTWATGAM